MISLTELKPGEHCRITWILGKLGEELQDRFGIAEDDEAEAITNLRGEMIIACRNHRLALSPETTFRIKVERIS